jgi:hypothetical protein
VVRGGVLASPCRRPCRRQARGAPLCLRVPAALGAAPGSGSRPGSRCCWRAGPVAGPPRRARRSPAPGRMGRMVGRARWARLRLHGHARRCAHPAAATPRMAPTRSCGAAGNAPRARVRPGRRGRPRSRRCRRGRGAPRMRPARRWQVGDGRVHACAAPPPPRRAPRQLAPHPPRARTRCSGGAIAPASIATTYARRTSPPGAAAAMPAAPRQAGMWVRPAGPAGLRARCAPRARRASAPAARCGGPVAAPRRAREGAVSSKSRLQPRGPDICPGQQGPRQPAVRGPRGGRRPGRGLSGIRSLPLTSTSPPRTLQVTARPRSSRDHGSVDRGRGGVAPPQQPQTEWRGAGVGLGKPVRGGGGRGAGAGATLPRGDHRPVRQPPCPTAKRITPGARP